MRTLLTIELIPSSMWEVNLRNKLTKLEWDRLKKKVYETAGGVCEICGQKGKKHPVENHEIWEYIEGEENIQKLTGFIALCPICHKCKHWGRSSLFMNVEILIKHLAKVNGWTKDDVLLYVEGCFEQWMQRSQKEWKLDISLDLSNYLSL